MQLTEDTYFMYAIKSYNNPNCISEQEFLDDLAKITVIKKMINYYLRGVNVNIRLLTNHLIMFYNVFEHHAGTSLIAYKIDDDYKAYLNSLLIYLNLPTVQGYDYDEELYKYLVKEFGS